jgi:hypothetical protein
MEFSKMFILTKSKKPLHHNFFFEKVLDGWIKSGRDKISARGPQIGPSVQHTDEKLKDRKKRQIDKQIELDRTKRRSFHKNERIKELQ